MFDILHSTNFNIMYTFQWWRIFVSWYHIVRILVLWWFHLVWWGMFSLNQCLCDNCIDLGKFIVMFLQCLIKLFSSLFTTLLVVIILNLYYGDQSIQLVLHICFPTQNYEYQVTKERVTQIGWCLWKFGDIWVIINKWITWKNKCIKHVIWIEEVWDNWW